jgi:hypothetical protein
MARWAISRYARNDALVLPPPYRLTGLPRYRRTAVPPTAFPPSPASPALAHLAIWVPMSDANPPDPPRLDCSGQALAEFTPSSCEGLGMTRYHCTPYRRTAVPPYRRTAVPPYRATASRYIQL